MDYLADTNIQLHWIEPGTPLCEQARAAVRALRIQGEDVLIAPQNLVECWSAATRPAQANGLGLAPAEVDREARHLEDPFPLAPDSPAIHPEWCRLVVDAKVSGVQVHDARLAAMMRVHRIPHILTFNVSDFWRFAGITAVHPDQVS